MTYSLPFFSSSIVSSLSTLNVSRSSGSLRSLSSSSEDDVSRLDSSESIGDFDELLADCFGFFNEIG